MPLFLCRALQFGVSSEEDISPASSISRGDIGTRRPTTGPLTVPQLQQVLAAETRLRLHYESLVRGGDGTGKIFPPAPVEDNLVPAAMEKLGQQPRVCVRACILSSMGGSFLLTGPVSRFGICLVATIRIMVLNLSVYCV